MFGDSFWNHHPFSLFGISHVPGYDLDDRLFDQRFRRPQHRRRRSLFATDTIEGSEFSADRNRVNQYRHDNESMVFDRLDSSFFFEYEPRPDSELALRSLQVRIPQRSVDTLGVREDDVLILPDTLTHLKVQIRSHSGNKTIHAAVVGDMRVRDMIRHLVPVDHAGEVRTYVKIQGDWQTLGPDVRVAHVGDMGRFAMNERGQVEIKIELRGNRGTRDFREWERERAWRWRG